MFLPQEPRSTTYRRWIDFAGANTMWDTVLSSTHQLSHDMPCGQCGHAMHTFLACSDACDCTPAGAPTRVLAQT